ncbi:hypothetical protein FS837_003320 [Tulasnella sp. UAMH 9824]|nr:hypothetical protein FS837_003320 [Tulasnella sp. UAMH 9824]
MSLLLQSLQLSTDIGLPEREEKLITFNQALSRFTANLPYDFDIKDGSEVFFNAEIRCIVLLATIKMHQAEKLLEPAKDESGILFDGPSQVDEKSLTVARGALDVAANIFKVLKAPDCDLTVKDSLGLVSGYIWAEIGIVLIQEISKLKSLIGTQEGIPNAVTSQIKLCLSDLKRLVRILSRMAKVFHTLNTQIGMLDNLMNGIA